MPARLNENGMRYLRALPQQPIPDGRYLVHNQVIPEAGLGQNGFRAWTQDTRKGLMRCYCNFGNCRNAELHKHYRVQFGENADERRAFKASHAAIQDFMKNTKLAKDVPIFQAWQAKREHAALVGRKAYQKEMRELSPRR